MCSLEHVELLLGLGELVLGHLGLEDLLDKLPELLVLLVQEDNKACGLRVERRRNVLDGLGDELLDTLIGDGDLVGQGVDGAAVAHSIEERHVVGHFGSRI